MVAVITTAQQATSTWTDSNVTSGHRYAYWVTAYEPTELAESQPSNTWSAVLP